MQKFINNEIKTKLNIPEILAKLIISSPIGKKQFQTPKIFNKNEKAEWENEFLNLKKLNEKIIINEFCFQDFHNILSHFKDIENLFDRTDTYEIYEIQEIKGFLYFLLKIINLIKKYDIQSKLQDSKLDELFEFLDIENKKLPTFYLSNLYSTELENIRKKIAENSQKIKYQKTKILDSAQKKMGINKLKTEVVVSRLNTKIINRFNECELYFLQDENFANFTFRLHKNEKIVEFEKENKILLENLMVEDEKVRGIISQKIFAKKAELKNVYQQVGEFDIALAKANFMMKYDCCIPVLSDKILVTEIVNIPLKEMGESNGHTFQKIDLEFSNNLNIITGANMAGKTSCLKTVGQIAFLSALAIPIPAKSAEVQLFDFIFFSAASVFSKRMDLSSFGVEVADINFAINKKGFGLYLIDEFARGTNPQEGEAFSRAIFENFLEKESITIATTHFQAPTKITSAAHFQMKGLKIDDEIVIDNNSTIEERISNLHKLLDYSLVNVSANCKPVRSALLVAASLGIDNKIITKAKKYLDENEN